MDTKTFTLYASALLSALNQGDEPSGMIYAAFMTKGITLDQYNDLLAILKAQGFITEAKSHMLSLTSKGREFAKQIDSVIGAG